jgi:DHA3 family macrolide efflux protein-like MFS transporter
MKALYVETKNPPMQNKYRRNFILLCFGRTASGLGSSLFGFGMSLYVLDLTGSAAVFSLIFGLSILPGVLVNLFASVFIDRSNKKKVMVIADIISGIMVFLFFGIFKANPQSILLFVMYSVSLSLIQSLFTLAISSSIPEFVDKDNVARVNSTMQALGASISIVGPILGAIAYKAIGFDMLFLLNGTALILAGLAEIFLVYAYIAPVSSMESRKSYFSDLRFTFEYLGKYRVLAFFFIFAAIINFIYNPLMFVVLPYVNYNQIRVTGLQLSLIQAAAATGVILAALAISIRKLLYKMLLRKFFTLFKAQAVLIMAWIFPVLPIFKAGSKWYIVAIFSMILILYGAMNTAQNIPMITYFQLKIPDNMRARIIGVFSTSLYISSPIGMWLYGILLENVKWTYVTFVSGVVMLVLGVFAGRNKYYQEFLQQQENQEVMAA